jgi:hypothetical protein
MALVGILELRGDDGFGHAILKNRRNRLLVAISRG